MKSRLFNLVVILSLIACAVSAVAWIRYGGGWISWHRDDWPFHIDRSAYQGADNDTGFDDWGVVKLIEWAHYTYNKWLFIPGWVLVALTAVLPGVWTIRHRRRSLAQQRRSNGLCPTCGYDIRASPGRCPECGTAKLDCM